MISGGELYSVISAVVPLYVAMLLAYGSVRWWKIFSPEQCAGINKFVATFAVPLLSFEFISRINPYKMNFLFMAADSLSKVIVLLPLILWAKYSNKGSLDWVITAFSLTTLPNTLVMGIPLLKAMYGDSTEILMVQVVVLQCIIWYTLLLVLFEYRSASMFLKEQYPYQSFMHGKDTNFQTDAIVNLDGEQHVNVVKKPSSPPISESLEPRLPSERLHDLRYKHLMPGSSTNRSVALDVMHSSIQSARNLQRMDSTSSTRREIVSGLPSRVSSPCEQQNCIIGSYESGSINWGSGSHIFSNRYLAKLVSHSAMNSSPNPGYDDPKDLQMFIWSSPSSISEACLSEIQLPWEEPQILGESLRSGNKLPSLHGDLADVTKDSRLLPNFTTSEQILSSPTSTPPNTNLIIRIILITVWSKLLRNPNTYASLLGIIWALVSARWELEMPKIVKGSITILSNTGLGMAMFSLGLFMALQTRVIACGTYFAILGMVLRFVVGPVTMAVASLAVGLRGELLYVSIVQAALPEGIVPFVFARQYDVHADILSTAVIFGMIVSLPVTLLYYVLCSIG